MKSSSLQREFMPMLMQNARAESHVRPQQHSKRIGRYQILTELGRGGMADVHLALTRERDGRPTLVALKAIQSTFLNDRTVIDMFLAEARIAAYLHHPNIVQTHELTSEGSWYCLIMEYLEGRTMGEVARAAPEGEIPIHLSVRILIDALAGLHHSHEATDSAGRPLCIVHRDFSPENVFVTYDGRVKVLDFGIAKTADPNVRVQTAVREFKGKLRYSAPERFTGEKIDRRADVYSAGVVLWQWLTGRRLWAGHTDMSIMHKLARRWPISHPRAINPNVPVELDEICMRALAYSPEARFQTAAELRSALLDFLADAWPEDGQTLPGFMNELFAEPRAQFRETVEALVRRASSLSIAPALQSSSSIEQ